MSEVWTERVNDRAAAEAIGADVAVMFDALSARFGTQSMTLVMPRSAYFAMRKAPRTRNAIRRFPLKRLCLTSPLALMSVLK